MRCVWPLLHRYWWLRRERGDGASARLRRRLHHQCLLLQAAGGVAWRLSPYTVSQCVSLSVRLVVSLVPVVAGQVIVPRAKTAAAQGSAFCPCPGLELSFVGLRIFTRVCTPTFKLNTHKFAHTHSHACTSGERDSKSLARRPNGNCTNLVLDYDSDPVDFPKGRLFSHNL